MTDFFLNIFILDKSSSNARRVAIVHIQPNENLTLLYPPKSGACAMMIVYPWHLRHRLTQTDDYIGYDEAILYIKDALNYSKNSIDKNTSSILRDFEQTVGTWYFEHVSDKYAEIRLRNTCARCIQTKWRECISNPYHPICKNRLLREYNELIM
jgi:hypothetical protein